MPLKKPVFRGSNLNIFKKQQVFENFKNRVFKGFLPNNNGEKAQNLRFFSLIFKRNFAEIKPEK